MNTQDSAPQDSAPQGSAPQGSASPGHSEKTGIYSGSVNYLNCSRGFRSWALTLDHKRIGLMYLVSVMTSFFVAGFFALMVRTEHLGPGPTIPFIGPDGYNQLFTLHGAIMVFLFIIPSIPAALGNFVLPLMIGAKDVAFPRLNLFSYYLWVTGALWCDWMSYQPEFPPVMRAHLVRVERDEREIATYALAVALFLREVDAAEFARRVV